MPPIDLQLLNGVRQDIAATRAARDQLAAQLAQHTADLARIEADIAARTSAGDRQGAAAGEAERQRLLAQRKADAARVGGIDDALRAAIDRLRVIDPCDADPSFPLLLLPVRIETRFTPDRAALRVRVFPDDVHVDQLDRGLSDDEQAAGRAYWSAAWHADDAGAGAAFRELVDRVGARRATWVATALTPVNLTTRSADAAPAFPEVSPRTKRAAVARLLPDCFTVVALQGDAKSSKTGAAIAPEVVVGLLADDGTDLVDVGGVKVASGAEWIVDYAQAEHLGLAITLPLAKPGAAVDQLFVFGVRRSLAPASVPHELESLFLAHRCTKGLAFVPQGTPTNNTETDRADWTRRADPAAPARDPRPAPGAGSNAAVLASALGIDALALAGLDHADDREQPRAQAANVALWGPSWGSFLDKLDVVGKQGSTLSDATREKVRRFHRDFVRGRGPLPALRIGKQPYGVLPASAVDRRFKANIGDTFEDGLLQLLKRVRARWRTCLANVPRLGAGTLDGTLTELLGSSPVSLSLRVRTVLSEDVATTASKVTGTATTDLELERMLEEMILEELILNASLVRRTGSLAVQSRPLALPLVDDANDPAALASIMAGGAPKVTSVLQALVMLAWDRASREVRDASAGGRLAELVQAADKLPQDAKDRVLAVANRADRVDAPTFFNEAARVSTVANVPPATLSEYQPVAATRRSFGELALTSTTAASRGALGANAVVGWLNASGRLAELRAALTELATTIDGAPASERRLLVAEALDVASHRLDAWFTALVERRRRAQRAAQPTGLSIGAYGWVFGITPSNDARGDGGFVHAPSMAHATTAGILRSAYLSHNADAAGSGAFAIDLTSPRVRTALQLLDGIRAGQPLGALLGYRIERALHEAGHDRLVLSLRTIAPLTQGKLSDRGDAVPQASIEALAAANVTDGLQLIEKYQGKVDRWDANRIKTQLGTRPADNPYLTGAWDPLSAEEWTTVEGAILDAIAACDAASDLLMAESVHQLAQGNVARASAALDAAGSGDVPPPEPDVIASRVEGTPLTHRVLIVAAGGAPWSASRPRAQAAPQLEAWAAARLGDPASIAVGAADDGSLLTLRDTGLAALDVVYDAGDRTLFEQRLRAALPGLAADAPLFDEPEPGWPAERRAIGDVFELAAALRALLVAARPASPLDLGVPNGPVTRAVDGATLSALQARLVAATGLLEVRAQALQAALAAEPFDAALVNGALEPLAAFGVAVPRVAADSLVHVATVALAEAARRIANADAELNQPAVADRLVAAGEALFGNGFWTVPAIGPAPAADAWQAAFGAGAIAPATSEIRRFLADLGAVRDGVRRYEEALLLAEAAGAPPALRAVQLAGVGDVAPSTWIGGALGAAEPSPTAPVASAIIDAAGVYDGSGPTIALVVDQWVDVLPVRERRGEAADAPVDVRATTGISFNAQAASARAPQSMLLAISPDGARWTTDAVLDVLLDVFELAQLRAVTLERTNGIARVLPALYEQSWSLQGEKVLDLRFVAEKAFTLSAIPPYVKEG